MRLATILFWDTTGCGDFQARNPQSPVRIHQGSTAKTPRNHGNFSGRSWMRARSLCNSRLGGGESGIRTCSIALLSPALRWGESRANPNSPLGNREIRTCSIALPSPAHRRGESRANPNRPTWQQRQTRDAVSFRAGTRSLRFGYARARRPKPRGIAGFSWPPRALTEKSLRRQTKWRREWDSNPRYLSVHTLSKRAP